MCGGGNSFCVRGNINNKNGIKLIKKVRAALHALFLNDLITGGPELFKFLREKVFMQCLIRIHAGLSDS